MKRTAFGFKNIVKVMISASKLFLIFIKKFVLLNPLLTAKNVLEYFVVENKFKSYIKIRKNVNFNFVY